MVYGLYPKLKKSKSIITLVAAGLLVGCASTRQLSFRELDSIPTDDCLNQHIYDTGLTNQLYLEKDLTQSGKDYATKQREIKQKLWEVRFNCRKPV